MFDSEAQMRKPVIRWMTSLDLHIKAEFVTPWGICDFAGIKLRSLSVKHRRKLGQNQPITSVTRAALLLEIPDEQTGHSISLRALTKKYSFIMPRDVVDQQTQRLIADKYVIRTNTGDFQKRNGWLPLHQRLIAVELKLRRIEEAMVQAKNNLLFAQESYVALPQETAERVVKRSTRWSQFFESGVGLVAVSRNSCEIAIASNPPTVPDFLLQFCSVEKFWRTLPKRS